MRDAMTPVLPRTLPARSVRAFVWDLADEGIDEVLDRLHDAGADGLHLAMAYHGGRFLCPHNPQRTLVHAPDGVLYFQPLLSCYEGIRPRVHPEYGSGAFAARVIEAVQGSDMRMTAWTVLFNNLTLSMARPDCTCVNAMGDRLEGSLCPSNPAVRAYGQALVEDLAYRVGVDAIEIEDFSFPTHESHIGPIWKGMELGPALGYLMTLCFCEHCRRRAEEANIEVDDLMRMVERMVRAGLRGDITERRIEDETSDPYHPVARFAKVRAETVTTLIDDLLDATDGSPARIQPVLVDEPDTIWRWGIELAALRQRISAATVRPGAQPAIIEAYIERYTDLLAMASQMVVDVPLNPFFDESVGTIRTAVEACEQAGIGHYVFSHYGLVPLDMLDVIGILARRG